MDKILDTVLLLALPASGKSEVRRYLEHLPIEERVKDLHMGPTVQLDDFPYVHMMRQIDDRLVAQGLNRIFFHAPDKPFQNPLDWGTLIALLNEDYDDLVAKRVREPESAAIHLFDRFDAASKRVGGRVRPGNPDEKTRKEMSGALEEEARKMLKKRQKGYPESLEGRTLVIEFARGGPDGARMPLPAPLGYRYSLSRLSEPILQKATILYVWVTPEESRRKNESRTDPNDPGSILHHGVPIDVMMNDYGCDDIDWMESNAQRPGTVAVNAHGKTFHLPIARFDNRVDKTSFLRDDPGKWKPEQVKAVHSGLKEALNKLSK